MLVEPDELDVVEARLEVVSSSSSEDELPVVDELSDCEELWEVVVAWLEVVSSSSADDELGDADELSE